MNDRLLSGTSPTLSPIPPIPHPSGVNFPVIQIGGQAFVMVPLSEFQRRNSNQTHWFLFLLGTGLLLLAGAAVLKPSPQAPEPVVIKEQAPPIVVDRGCIAFCR